MSGQGHEARASDCADLGLMVVNLVHHQFWIGFKKKAVFEGQRIVRNERVTLARELEEDLLCRRRIQMQRETFLAGAQELMVSAVFQILLVAEERRQASQAITFGTFNPNDFVSLFGKKPGGIGS